MAASLFLSLREGLEAALIIGIVLGVLRKMERTDSNSSIWAGVAAAVTFSTLAAVVLSWIGAEFEGRSEQLFEGITMFLAAGVLTWMVFWMHRQNRLRKQEIETGVRQAMQQNGGKGLFLLAFLAVAREGLELALFLQAARLGSAPGQQLFGVFLGIITAIFLGWLLFTGARRLNLSRFFQVTNIILALFAAGMVGLGIHEFNELGWIPALIDPVWNLGSILPDTTAVGQVLKAMVGYSSAPSLTQVIGYLGYSLVLAMIAIVKTRNLPVRQLAP